jgi:hypothetical protein
MIPIVTIPIVNLLDLLKLGEGRNEEPTVVQRRYRYISAHPPFVPQRALAPISHKPTGNAGIIYIMLRRVRFVVQIEISVSQSSAVHMSVTHRCHIIIPVTLVHIPLDFRESKCGSKCQTPMVVFNVPALY